MTKILSIVILSFNGKKILFDCLRSIPKSPKWQIFVADNGSNDGTLEMIRTNFPEIILIENKSNIGFAAGNNIVLKKIETEFVLLLNPDTIVYPNSIETVLKYMQENPLVGAATCRVELPSGELDYSCHRGFPDPINSLLHFVGLKKFSSYTAQNIPSTVHEIDSLTGAFALIRTSVGKQVNWLDEEYFWNGEDIDFCYKVKEKGWKIMYLPDVKITHLKGYASKASKDRRLAWAKNSTEVMRLFYKKHLAKKYPIIVNIAVYIGIYALKIIRTAKNI